RVTESAQNGHTLVRTSPVRSAPGGGWSSLSPHPGRGSGPRGPAWNGRACEGRRLGAPVEQRSREGAAADDALRTGARPLAQLAVGGDEPEPRAALAE